MKFTFDIMLLGILWLSNISPLVAQEENRFEDDIQKFEQDDQASPPQKESVLFLGSSSIRMWSSLADDFGDIPVLNRGFGGSQTSDAIYFFDRIVLPYQPSIIAFYEGDNDLASDKTPQRVFQDFKQFVEMVRKHLPETYFIFIAIKPSPARYHLLEQIRTANAMIKDYCDRHPDLEYADVFSPMMSPNGRPDGSIFLEDSLHMNSAGYAIWRESIKPLVEKRISAR